MSEELIEKKRLARAQFDVYPIANVDVPMYFVPGAKSTGGPGTSYHDIIQRCRYFYENDTIAGTVIDRMVDISQTEVRNNHGDYSDEVKYYFDGVAQMLTSLLRAVSLSYLIDGMAVPEYRTEKMMGNRFHQKLGRTRYTVPTKVWMRDPLQIKLYKTPVGDRVVVFKISADDIAFIRDKGKPNREQEYADLLKLYPDYVAAVQGGQTEFKLDCKLIARKITSYNVYPLPFLKKTIGALEYRRSLKRMDKITAERVIASIRQVKVGSDEFPSDDEDIEAARQIIGAQHVAQDTLLTVYTNHTIDISWITPPMQNILDNAKYDEANADVFMGMGFPRLWAVGENERSNSSDNKLASVGPIATLESMRNDILDWIRWFYARMAEENGFTRYPDPYWSPINTASAQDLIQYATQFIDKGVISKNTGSELYGRDFSKEQEKIKVETEEAAPVDGATDPQQQGQNPQNQQVKPNDTTNQNQGSDNKNRTGMGQKG